jgi:hypothetical protein
LAARGAPVNAPISVVRRTTSLVSSDFFLPCSSDDVRWIAKNQYLTNFVSKITYKTDPTCVVSPTIKFSTGSLISAPALASSKVIPSSTYKPSTQYLKKTFPASPALPATLLTTTPTSLVSTNYALAALFGVLNVTGQTLSIIPTSPVISRDGGRGGYINGDQIFVFCDTSTYVPSGGQVPLSFRSNSVSVDQGRLATGGVAAVLTDPIGQWQNSTGTQRGFIPLTQGEDAYNIGMQAKGYRYAIWSGSSLIPYNCSTAVLYAQLVFVTPLLTFTHVGNTLLYVKTDKLNGPIATRKVDLMFKQTEISWGSFGAIRSWGTDGIGGNTGKVYLIGAIGVSSLVVARVNAATIETKSTYEYWNGASWTLTMPTATKAFSIMTGSFSSGDIFYSPYHRTYIFVYMNNLADSTFHYRYLLAPAAIIPSTGTDTVEAIVKYSWSAEQTLLKTPSALSGQYTYAGGIQAGYFGADDITNGGLKMLLSWSSPTGQLGNSALTQYQIPTAQITWK